jgi:hypothetical protein
MNNGRTGLSRFAPGKTRFKGHPALFIHRYRNTHFENIIRQENSVLGAPLSTIFELALGRNFTVHSIA